MRRALLVLFAVLATASAARAQEPFDLLAFFRGETASRGEIRTLFVFRERFEARFFGRREADGTLLLDERFRFEDGERLQRWRLRRSEGALVGTVETEGRDGRLRPPVPVRGAERPDGAVIEYDGFAPGGGRTRLRFRHEMRLNGDGTVANRVAVLRFGLPLARSAVTFSKRDDLLPPAREPR